MALNNFWDFIINSLGITGPELTEDEKFAKALGKLKKQASKNRTQNKAIKSAGTLLDSSTLALPQKLKVLSILTDLSSASDVDKDTSRAAGERLGEVLLSGKIDDPFEVYKASLNGLFFHLGQSDVYTSHMLKRIYNPPMDYLSDLLLSNQLTEHYKDNLVYTMVRLVDKDIGNNTGITASLCIAPYLKAFPEKQPEALTILNNNAKSISYNIDDKNKGAHWRRYIYNVQTLAITADLRNYHGDNLIIEQIKECPMVVIKPGGKRPQRVSDEQLLQILLTPDNVFGKKYRQPIDTSITQAFIDSPYSL